MLFDNSQYFSLSEHCTYRIWRLIKLDFRFLSSLYSDEPSRYVVAWPAGIQNMRMKKFLLVLSKCIWGGETIFHTFTIKHNVYISFSSLVAIPDFAHHTAWPKGYCCPIVLSFCIYIYIYHLLADKISLCVIVAPFKQCSCMLPDILLCILKNKIFEPIDSVLTQIVDSVRSRRYSGMVYVQPTHHWKHWNSCTLVLF